MSKVFIEETTLTNIGTAIREKTGKTDLIAPGDMPAEIRGIVSGGGSDDCNGLHIPEEALIITGNCDYRFSQGGWDWFINQVGDRVTTKDILSAPSMFAYSKVENIPFDLNFTPNLYSNSLTNIFQYSKIKTAPQVKNIIVRNIDKMFLYCQELVSIPENFTETWDWTDIDNQTSSYTGNMSQMFSNCNKLRHIPRNFINHGNPSSSYSYTVPYNGFLSCYALEEIEDLSYSTNTTLASNMFYHTVDGCCRLKRLTLITQEDGTPYTCRLKNQTIDLTVQTGNFKGTATAYVNAGLPEDTVIDNEEKWRGYIDGTYPDGWTADVAYNTFGATAVKELIATLPDTSAYLATTTGTNTLKLLKNSASAIPGEHIETNLTEEDIAVATAKGWTVSLV